MDLVFALVTDVHWGKEAGYDGKLRKLTSHAQALTRQFVDRMNESVHPDLVVDLGDDIEDESREADRATYRQCFSLLSECTAPVRHVAGNHDLIHLTEDDLCELWGHRGPLYYSFDLRGAHFVVLYTRETRDVGVDIDEAQLEWLASDLEHANAPAIVLMHHAASEQDVTHSRWFYRAPHLCMVAERRRMRRILLASKKVLAVFNGHVHWNHFDLCDTIPFFTVQSLTENVDDDAPGRPARAHAVCHLTDERLAVEVAGAEPARYQIELGRAADVTAERPDRSRPGPSRST